MVDFKCSKLIVSADWQFEPLLYQQDLPLQQPSANSSCFSDFDPLLLCVDDAGFCVALGFHASVVFVELFRCLGVHFANRGGFGEFLIDQ